MEAIVKKREWKRKRVDSPPDPNKKVKLIRPPLNPPARSVKKGFFPHLFNSETNWNYRGSVPKNIDYICNQMKPKKRTEFDDWYGKQNGKIFDLKTNLKQYCVSDVDVLRQAAETFQQTYLGTTKVDPFESMTIASACNTFYRTEFLEPNTIGIVPATGYRRVENQSY